MLRLKYGVRLVAEVVDYSRANRAWWLLPVVLLLGMVAVAMSATSAVVPVAVYTLF